MRKSEIEVGGEYAVISYEGATARRVRIEAFGAERTVYAAGSWHGHISRDGILVTVLDRTTGEVNTRTETETIELEQPIYSIGQPPVTTEERTVEVPRQDVVISRHIVRTWEEQEQFEARQAERKHASEEYAAAQRATLESVRAGLAARGLIQRPGEVEFTTSGGGNLGPFHVNHGTVTIPLAALEVLLDGMGGE